MKQPDEHPESLRRRVILLFFTGLLVMAAVAVGIGRVSGEWGRIQLGWINLALGLGLVLGGTGLVIGSVSIQYTLGRGTPAPAVATKKLVTQGPYACTRNPMTLGALGIYLGIGVWMGSGVVILASLVVFSLLLRFIYLHETRELTRRFGQEYLDYRESTPFLLPRCRKTR